PTRWRYCHQCAPGRPPGQNAGALGAPRSAAAPHSRHSASLGIYRLCAGTAPPHVPAPERAFAQLGKDASLMDYAYELLIIGVMLMFNAVFTAFEMALASVSQARLVVLVE